MLFNIQFFTILNIIISVLKVDIILLNNNYKKLIKKNYNLNLLAIKKKFQSKGIGKFFLKELIKRIKTQKHTSYITCETFNDKALDFYIKKLFYNFFLIQLNLLHKLIHSTKWIFVFHFENINYLIC